MTGSAPRVSVLVAAHDAGRFLRPALESALRQTMSDLELVVVDDGSSDGTAAILAAIDDPRLVVLRNAERLGLAASLDRGLNAAQGRYVARLDADDVAVPGRLDAQLRRLERDGLGIVGSAILEIDADGRPGALHRMPSEPRPVRWAALFSSPFYHPSVLVDRELLDRHGLRYDPAFEESEDYDLWARLLRVADGANVPEPLVLYRVHAAQATSTRRDVQRRFQLEVALREIAEVAPGLHEERAELAWRLGAHEPLDPNGLDDAAEAFRELLVRFEERHGRDAEVRRAASRVLARRALRGDGSPSAGLARRALELDPALPLRAVAARARRRSVARRAREEATRWLRALERAAGVDPALRVTVVSPEPTPYRAPLFDLLAARADLELTVVYAAETLAGRTWAVEPAHPFVVLHGARVPGARALVHHDYTLTPGIARALRDTRPDVVVVSGWSTFPCQAAVAWCRARGVPYVLQVESHDAGPRAGWRRAVKGSVVPRLVRGASGVLVTGTLVRRAMLERGARPDRLGTFAVTVDVDAFAERARRLEASRGGLRRGLGAAMDDVVVLSVARLAPEKGLDTLVRGVAAADDPRLVLVVAGEGTERARLQALASELGVRLVLTGDVAWERIGELYAAADVFALLSEREPWGVVVNEAAASGLPLVLSERVGAAHDLLRDGENGALVGAGDVGAAAAALRRLAADPELRRRHGARSRELVAAWGYGPSVEDFVAAVREAVVHGPPR